MRMNPNKFCMNPHTHRFPLRATASAVMVAALGTAALAQEGTALPSVTVQSTRASATLPLRSTAQAEREKLDKVPGGTNLAEPQKEARLATLRECHNKDLSNMIHSGGVGTKGSEERWTS